MVTNEEVVGRFSAAGITREQAEALLVMGYLDAPASIRHHLARPGGLAEHSFNVADTLGELTRTLGIRWNRPEGPLVVGYLHDLVKLRSYVPVGSGDIPTASGYKWSPTAGDRHGDVSVRIAYEVGIRLEEDEKLAIRYHMGRFGIGKEYLEHNYAHALKMYPKQVLAAHYADWWSSEVIERGAS